MLHTKTLVESWAVGQECGQSRLEEQREGQVVISARKFKSVINLMEYIQENYKHNHNLQIPPAHNSMRCISNGEHRSMGVNNNRGCLVQQVKTIPGLKENEGCLIRLPRVYSNVVQFLPWCVIKLQPKHGQLEHCRTFATSQFSLH